MKAEKATQTPKNAALWLMDDFIYPWISIQKWKEAKSYIIYSHTQMRNVLYDNDTFLMPLPMGDQNHWNPHSIPLSH